jgi:hypothetical protein
MAAIQSLNAARKGTRASSLVKNGRLRWRRPLQRHATSSSGEWAGLASWS